jgi:NADH-quinone oxidoreductase subunit J
MNTFPINITNLISLPITHVTTPSSALSFSEISFILFLSFMLLLSLFIIFSKDVIYCLLGLISLYILGAFLLLSYNLQFLSFSLVVVSLGAVAVLFLYVVLMVNLKGSRMQESMYYKFNISCFLISLSFLSSILYIKKEEIDCIYFADVLSRFFEHNSNVLITPVYINVTDLALEVNNNLLKLYGLIVYDKYFIFFVLIGVLLLSALIGCLLLSFDYDTSKKTFGNKIHLTKINYSRPAKK